MKDCMAKIESVLSRSKTRADLPGSGGRKIIGYWCHLTPVELITAAGMIPYRVCGDPGQPQSKADECIESCMCPYVRSCFDLGLRNRYDFLAGLVVPHACNSMDSLHSFWKCYVKSGAVIGFNSPHTTGQHSFAFTVEEMLEFKRTLEELGSVKISDSRLRKAISIHNEKRSLLRRLSLLKREDPPLLSGTEMLKVAKAVSLIEPEEGIALLKEVTEEVRQRKPVREGARKPRLLVYAMCLDAPDTLQVIEDSNSHVVLGYFCPDARTYWLQVEESGAAIESLADYYLRKMACPRAYDQDWSNTLGQVRTMCKEFKAQGCICWSFRYCDTFQLDLPQLRDMLREDGIPMLEIDSSYSEGELRQQKTRLEGFIESLAD